MHASELGQVERTAVLPDGGLHAAAGQGALNTSVDSGPSHVKTT